MSGNAEAVSARKRALHGADVAIADLDHCTALGAQEVVVMSGGTQPVRRLTLIGGNDVDNTFRRERGEGAIHRCQPYAGPVPLSAPVDFLCGQSPATLPFKDADHGTPGRRLPYERWTPRSRFHAGIVAVMRIILKIGLGRGGAVLLVALRFLGNNSASTALDVQRLCSLGTPATRLRTVSS